MRNTVLTTLTLTAGFVAMGVALSKPSFAYIDPGSGSYFAQMLIASAASFFLFVVKPLWRDIKQLFSKAPKEAVKEEKPVQTDENKK